MEYYKNYIVFNGFSSPRFGGYWDDIDDAGTFRLYILDPVNYSTCTTGCRLMFL